MTTPTPDDPPPNNLTPDYQSPPHKKPDRVFLILTIFAALGVAFFCFIAFANFAEDKLPVHATILAVGILLFTAAGVALKKIGMSAALAILLTSLAIFILMCGLCGSYDFLHLGYRPPPPPIAPK